MPGRAHEGAPDPYPIATVIMVEGELGLKQLTQGCTYAPGKIPAEDPDEAKIQKN